MIAVFSGFISSGEQMLKVMGFRLAIAVFFDTFIIRMAVVPAVLAYLHFARMGAYRCGVARLVRSRVQVTRIRGQTRAKRVAGSTSGAASSTSPRSRARFSNEAIASSQAASVTARSRG